MVVAHRGASSGSAEHTLDAYVTAIESGADALECDVRMTRDGHLVCVHDRTVNRTSDGRGVVSELDLDGLKSLNFASWHSDLPTSADQLLSDTPYLAGIAPDRVERGRWRAHPGAVTATRPRCLAAGSDARRDQAPDALPGAGREGTRAAARPLRLGRGGPRADAHGAPPRGAGQPGCRHELRRRRRCGG